MGRVALGDDLDTLCCRVSTLIVLTGQRLDSEDDLAIWNIKSHIINLGLGENSIHCIVKEALLDIFCIVAIQNTDGLQCINLQKILNFLQQAVSLMGLTNLLFNIYAINHWLPLLICWRPVRADRCHFCGMHSQTAHRLQDDKLL